LKRIITGLGWIMLGNILWLVALDIYKQVQYPAYVAKQKQVAPAVKPTTLEPPGCMEEVCKT